MVLTPDEIERQAIALAPELRARLAEHLLDSLSESSVSAVRDAWAREIAARVEAHDRGEAASFDAAMVFNEARRIAR